MSLFFFVPWIGADALELRPDLYYLLYFTAGLAFFGTFVLLHADGLRPLWRARLGWSLGVGALMGLLLLIPIFREPSTPHPGGLRFAFEIVWRGVIYGLVDALVLYVFPAAVAFLLMRGDRETGRRKVAFAGLTLALSLLLTAAYHVGYSEYRGSLIRYPEIGAVASNVPTLVTLNPVGAVVAHSTMHVGAVVRQYEGGDQHLLPPRVEAGYANRGSDDVAAALACGWFVVIVGGVLVLRRRDGRAKQA